MDSSRLSKSVRRIVVFSQDASGAVVPATIYRKADREKRKGMRALRPFETATRRMADATAAYVSSYSDRHRTSNEKKRDGWLRDFNMNVVRAAKQGTKRLKLNRVFIP